MTTYRLPDGTEGTDVRESTEYEEKLWVLHSQLGLILIDRDKLTEVEPSPVYVALTMTPDAGRAFGKALSYAANRILTEARTEDGEMTHEDWLRWGASRFDAAIRAAETSGTKAAAALTDLIGIAPDRDGTEAGQCGCSFDRWGRDSFKITVCDEHTSGTEAGHA